MFLSVYYKLNLNIYIYTIKFTYHLQHSLSVPNFPKDNYDTNESITFQAILFTFLSQMFQKLILINIRMICSWIWLSWFTKLFCPHFTQCLSYGGCNLLGWECFCYCLHNAIASIFIINRSLLSGPA